MDTHRPGTPEGVYSVWDVLYASEQIRETMLKEGSSLIRSRRYHIRHYSRCFVGEEVTSWLLQTTDIEDRNLIVKVMNLFFHCHIIHHVCDDHVFKDDYFFYRFRTEDGTMRNNKDNISFYRSLELYKSFELCGITSTNVFNGRIVDNAFCGSELLDYFQTEKDLNRHQAQVECKDLIANDIITPVNFVRNGTVVDLDEFQVYVFTFDFSKTYNLADLSNLYDRWIKAETRISLPSFIENDVKNRKTKVPPDDDADSLCPPSKFRPRSMSAVDIPQPVTRASSMPSSHVQKQLEKAKKRKEQASSKWRKKAEGVIAEIADTNNNNLNKNNIDEAPTPSRINEEFRKEITMEDLAVQMSCVKRTATVVCDSVGYGVVLRGQGPVYVHAIDPVGPAYIAGLKEGDIMVSVNGTNVVHWNHKQIADTILNGPEILRLEFMQKSLPHVNDMRRVSTVSTMSDLSSMST